MRLNIPVGIRFPTLQFDCVKNHTNNVCCHNLQLLLQQYLRLLQSQSTSKRYQRIYAFRGLKLFASTMNRKKRKMLFRRHRTKRRYRIRCRDIIATNIALLEEHSSAHLHISIEMKKRVYERLWTSVEFLRSSLHYFIIISFVRIKIS